MFPCTNHSPRNLLGHVTMVTQPWNNIEYTFTPSTETKRNVIDVVARLPLLSSTIAFCTAVPSLLLSSRTRTPSKTHARSEKLFNKIMLFFIFLAIVLCAFSGLLFLFLLRCFHIYYWRYKRIRHVGAIVSRWKTFPFSAQVLFQWRYVALWCRGG